jgi:holo-[acyl-carrier protein] synthase
MSKLATGIDLIEIERFVGAVERHGRHFLERIFTTRELAEVGDDLISLAARFAAKEAVAKALGTGIGQVTWHEIEVLRQQGRAPELHLHGAAESLAEKLELNTWSISLSHTQTQAIAMIVAMGD